MKKLFTILLIVLSINSYSKTSQQEKEKIIKEQSDGIPGQSTNTTLTAQEVYNDVKSAGPDVQNALKSLAKSLKVTVDKLWNILVRQQLVNSVGYLILMILSILSWINFYYRVKQGELNRNTYSWRDSDTITCIISGMLAIVGTILSSIHFQPMLTGFLNPEYGAIETILETTKYIQKSY